MARIGFAETLVSGLSILSVATFSFFDPSAAADPQVFVTTQATPNGSVDSMGIVSPWPIATNVASTASDATVRVFYDRIYLVSSSEASVRVIDPDTHGTLALFSVGPGSQPHDILIVDPNTAYVSRHASNSILKMDPTDVWFRGRVSPAAGS